MNRRVKAFDGARVWEVILLCALMAAPFVMILAKI